MVSDFFEYGKEKNKKTKSSKTCLAARREEKAPRPWPGYGRGTRAQGARFAYKKARGRQESARGQKEREGTKGAEKESGFRFRLDKKRCGRQAAEQN